MILAIIVALLALAALLFIAGFHTGRRIEARDWESDLAHGRSDPTSAKNATIRLHDAGLVVPPDWTSLLLHPETGEIGGYMAGDGIEHIAARWSLQEAMSIKWQRMRRVEPASEPVPPYLEPPRVFSASARSV